MLRQTFQQFDGTEVAVIGMAGRFPGANDLATFWTNLHQGVESIKFFTEAELIASGVDSTKLQEANFVKACADLEGSDLFDAPFFGFSPRDAAIMDPQQRVFLECAWEALEDAGYDSEKYSGAVSVFAGCGMNAYMMYNLISNPDLIDSMGRFAVWTTGNDKDFLSTRVSYLLNLKGPSVNIQSACSTSLVAIHMASQSLLCSECDMALAGGVTLLLPQHRGYLYREGEINSPDGHCRAFDAKANGTVFGSGTGIVVLKRFADAIKDKDNIYAIIKGSAVNNDGSAKVGYTAPSVEGQASVITEALEVAGVHPETISYVEAHGTGTPIGDPIEVAALTQAFRARTAKEGFCAIGSLKTNIGHLDTAAGVAGFIKTVLALKHKELPPSLHYQTPNTEVDFAKSPFFVNARLSTWRDTGLPRRAGVSSLGVGGTNAHLILEEAPDLEPPGKSRPWQLLLQSARSDGALNNAASNLTKYLTQKPTLNLADVAFTLQVGRRGFKHRRMVVCRSLDEAVAAFERPDPKRVLTQATAEDDQSVSFMFPGQGSQYINMGRELYQEEPVFRRELDLCIELMQSPLGFNLRELLYPSETQADEAGERLLQTAAAQPAIFAIEYALAKLWMTWGVHPAAMIGHSIGEYVAACLAGVFSLEDAVSLVAARGRLMQQLPAGAMLAVSLPEKQLQPLLGEALSLAAVNGPSLCVASGTFEAIKALQSHLTGQHIDCTPLHTSHAFHSEMIDPILGPFAKEIRKVKLRSPQIPYVSNVTGSWIASGQATDPDYWVSHLRQTVRFADGLRAMLGTKGVLLEVGPGNALSTFARQQSTGVSRSVLPVSSLRHPNDLQSDLAFLLGALGRLWLAGVPINWSGFYAGEQRRRVSVPTYPFERQRYWIEPGRQATASASSNHSLKKKRSIADWFYLPTWKEAPLVTAGARGDLKEESAHWLVFAHESEFSSRLATGLKFRRGSLEGKGNGVTTVIPGKEFGKLSKGVYCIDPRRPADYDALLGDLAQLGLFPGRIVHLWNVTPLERIGPGIKDLERDLDLSFYSLLYLAQALGRRNLTDSVQIGVVATGIQQVAGEAVAHPQKATVLGPCKVIPHEFSNITCKSVDITLPESGSWQEERLINQLISEFSADSSSSVIAYRGHQRWMQTFIPVRLDEGFAAKRPLRQGGTYLITGGLGGMALALAEHLAKTVQAKLVLVGRRGLIPKEDWATWLASHPDQDKTSQRIRKVQALEQLGAEVFIAAADVADASQMRKVVNQAKERFGSIQGVIHAAGLIRDGLIQLKSRETAEEVLRPKVKGTLVLDTVLQGETLDFMVLCSSVSAITGPVGQVDYAAANAFLNAFAQQKALTDKTNTLAIEWGTWREVGMAAAAAQFKTPDGGDVTLGKQGSHPFLARCVVDSADEKVFLTELTDRHWVLDEHRFQTGEAVFPGAASLEIARAALMQNSHHEPIEIRDVLFLEPLVLKPGERRDLRFALKRSGNSFEFITSSESKSGQKRVHARGTVSYVDSLPARPQVLSAIEARCNISERTSADVEQSKYVNFGPRWKNIKRAKFGNDEALLSIELPEAFRADLEEYKLHPALLDMATGGAHALISGPEKLKDFYVPLSYGKARINAPLPAKLFSHIKVSKDKESQNGVAVFEVTMLDEDGIEIVQISNFVVRKISDTAKMTEQPQTTGDSQLQPQSGANYDKRDPISQALSSAVEQGIPPAEGVEAFNRALSGSYPRIVVTSQDLNALIEATDSSAKAFQASQTGQTEGTAATYPRPELLTKFVPPGTEQEKKIAEIWQELLGIQQIGIHDDFFELGGHSLMIVSVHNKVQQIFDVTFPVAKMFQYPTISTLANYLREGQGDKPSYGELRDRAAKQRKALVRQKQLTKGKGHNDR